MDRLTNKILGAEGSEGVEAAPAEGEGAIIIRTTLTSQE